MAPTSIDPSSYFSHRNADCGRNVLKKVFYQSLSKTFSYRNSELEKTKVLLLAPTGVAAIHIDGTTIHTDLNILVGRFEKHLLPLSDKMTSMLRNRLSEVKVLIICKVSMVSYDLLLHIQLRLTEIFASKDNFPFVGTTVIAVGDFLQLLPVRARPVYTKYKTTWHNLDSLWVLFEIAELMRQQRDNNFINVLSHVRTVDTDDYDVSILKSRFVLPTESYPKDVLHIFAENAPANIHNVNLLNSINSEICSITVIDSIPKNVALCKIEKVLNRSQSETGGLAGTLELKINARIILTLNVVLEDRLVNGQLGTAKHFQKDKNGNVLKIYIAFDDCEAGLKSISKDAFASRKLLVPIEMTEANIRIRTNKDSSPAVTRTQLPLMLAWGCTVHKAQGLTLVEVVISFDLVKLKDFNYGHMYFALSRVASLNSLYLLGEFNFSYIRADPRAIYKYHRM